MSKVMGIFVNFFLFTMPTHQNMVMSHDPRSKFRNFFYFVLILHLILGEVTEFLVKKHSTSEDISPGVKLTAFADDKKFCVKDEAF